MYNLSAIAKDSIDLSPFSEKFNYLIVLKIELIHFMIIFA